MNADLGSGTDIGPPPPSSRAPARASPVFWATGLAVSDLEGYGVDVLDAEDDVIEAPSPAAGYGHPVGLVEAVQVLVRGSHVSGTRRPGASDGQQVDTIVLTSQATAVPVVFVAPYLAVSDHEAHLEKLTRQSATTE